MSKESANLLTKFFIIWNLAEPTDPEVSNRKWMSAWFCPQLELDNVLVLGSRSGGEQKMKMRNMGNTHGKSRKNIRKKAETKSNSYFGNKKGKIEIDVF